MSEATPRRRAPLDVFKYQVYRAFLTDYFESQREAGESYRSFARKAELGAPNYAQVVLEGKRDLSPDMAARFARACGLHGDPAEYFQALVAFNQAETDVERREPYERMCSFARYRKVHALDIASREYYSHWFVPAIRELVACKDFREDAAWIARTLRPQISEAHAAKALVTLQRLGLLARTASGELVQSERAVATPAETWGMHVRRYHAEAMGQAVLALDSVKASERDISSVTVTASAATFEQLKSRLIALREEFAALCDADAEADTVYQINFQLFPVSKPSGAEEA